MISLKNFVAIAILFCISTVNAQNVFFDLDGVDDYAYGPFPVNSTLMPQGNTPRTIEAWIRPETVSNFHVIFNWGTTNPNERSCLMISGGKLAFVGEFNDLYGQTNLPVYTWTHVAASFDGDTVRLFVNGQLDGKKEATLNTSGHQFNLGRRINDNSEFFNGQIDEVRVWNVARTQSQIQIFQNQILTGSESGLNNYYSLIEKFCGITGQNIHTSIVNQVSGLHDMNIAGMNPNSCTSGFACAACGYPDLPLLSCNPPTGTPGFSPIWQQLAPVLPSQSYFQNFLMEIPSNLTIWGFPLTVNSFRLDSITGGPSGLQFSTTSGNLPVTIQGGDNVCISVSGTTYDSFGTYALKFWGFIDFGFISLNTEFIEMMDSSTTPLSDSVYNLVVINNPTGNGHSVGFTTFDLQTNYSACRRIAAYPNGGVGMTWTSSGSYDLASPDRGSGYNFFSGSAWENNAPFTHSRLEFVRTGWPNLVITDSGKELVISHTSGSGVSVASRNAGSGQPWSFMLLPNDDDAVWPRTANVGDTVYLIAGRQAALGHTFNNLPGGLSFRVSTDAGATFSAPQVIPGLDPTNFPNLDGDAFAIDANGSTVAIVAGRFRPTMFKSTDAGSTWSMHPLINISNPLYSGDIGQTLDSVTTGDNSFSILVDDNGMVHIWYGMYSMYDDDPNTAGWNYFPTEAGIMYWNESFGSGIPKVIPASQILNNDSNYCFTVLTSLGNPYFNMPVSMPQAGADASGNLYLSFSSVLSPSLDTLSGLMRRNVFLIKSTDGGNTWIGPINVSNPSNVDNGEEAVYPSIPRVITDSIRILYQSDQVVGTAVQNTQVTGFTENYMYYKAIHPDEIVYPATDFNCPVLNLNGITEITTSQYQPVNWAGITAFDVPFGDVSHAIFSVPTVDVSTVGSYPVTVYATDPSGNLSNSGSVIVHVVPGPFEIDYFAADQAYAGGIGADYPSFIWQVNQAYEVSLAPYDDTDNFKLKWAGVAFDTLYNAGTGMSQNYSPTAPVFVDTIQIAFSHQNVSGLQNEIRVSVIELSSASFGISSNDGGVTINNPVLWTSSIFSDSSLTTPGTVVFRKFAVGVTVPPGKRFGVIVNYYGPKQDEFALLAGFRDECSGSCGAEKSIFPDRSLFFFNYATPVWMIQEINPNVFYDCDGNSQFTPGGCEYLQIQNWAISAKVTFLDDPCPPPTMLPATRVTPTSVRVNWTAVNNAIGYVLAGATINSNQWTEIPVNNANATFLDLSGLANGVTYKFRIRAKCSNIPLELSGWSNIDTVTLQCITPTNPHASIVQRTSARLTWDRVFGCAGYAIQGRQAGAIPSQTILVGGSATTFRDVFGLQPNTAYEFRIRTWCDAQGIDKSPWSAWQPFTTNPRLEGEDLLGETMGNPTVLFYPNPTTGILHTGPETNVEGVVDLRVFNIHGKQVFQKYFENGLAGSQQIDLREEASGIYIISLQTSFGKETTRIVKE